eukprot:363930-Chlamydomonas_euryale.AAC.3
MAPGVAAAIPRPRAPCCTNGVASQPHPAPSCAVLHKLRSLTASSRALVCHAAQKFEGLMEMLLSKFEVFKRKHPKLFKAVM